MNKTMIILSTLLFSVLGQAQQCIQFLSNHTISAATLEIESIRKQRMETLSSTAVSGISSNSLSTLRAYYDIVDPSRAVQDVPNRELYLAPFKEDRRLTSLSESTKNKMVKLIESRLFKPFEALIVAKYLTNSTQTKNTELLASRLITLRVDELVLMNLKRQLENDTVQTNPRMKMSKLEHEQVRRYLDSKSRLDEFDLPKNFYEIEAYLNAINMGSFINSFLRRYLERIHSPSFIN